MTTSNIKILKKLNQNNERQSLVKELIALRPITPVQTTNVHPYQVLHEDSNPPPKPIDQFTPYLSRKLSIKRQEKISKLNSQQKQEDTFILTATKSTAQSRAKTSIRSPKSAKRDLETASYANYGNYGKDYGSGESNLPDIHEGNLDFGSEYGTGQISQMTSSQQSRSSKRLTNHNYFQHIKMESAFDKIASNACSVSLNRLMENTLQVYFLAHKVLFYHDISSVRVLYCPSTTSYCPHGTGIVGYTQYSRLTVRTTEAKSHMAYSIKMEGNQVPPD